MYEVFAGFHEVVRCEMVVLRSCHSFLLKPHLPLVQPPNLSVERVGITSRIETSSMHAQCQGYVILETSFKLLDDRDWKLARCYDSSFCLFISSFISESSIYMHSLRHFSRTYTASRLCIYLL
jgi:hypothetical protein